MKKHAPLPSDELRTPLVSRQDYESIFARLEG